MKNLNQLPEQVQVILSCICRKRQSDFLDKNIEHERTKADYKAQVEIDRQIIEMLSTEIEKMNDWKLFTKYWLENLSTF